MKRFVLTLAISVMVLFTLAISVFAAEYTVNNDAEYASAYEQAANGDTIVVAGKLTCDIYANKSVTYVLKADWESPKLVINQSNVEVSFIADGGDYKIMPTNYSTTEGWMNIAEVYEKVVINLGGKNGGTLTIDGSNATHDRVSYVPALVENTTYYSNVFPDICLNLLSGSAIANFNTTTKDDNVNACLLYAKTVNMYNGAEIYANKVISAPLIKSCYFNMYGGEIFGNLLTSTRMGVNGVGFIYADKQFTMYDGGICNNIFSSKASSQINVAGFISTNQGFYGAKAVVYGGELGDRYVTGIGSNEISAIVGVYVMDNGATCFYYNTGVTAGDRYIFKDAPQLALDQETGKTIWKVSNITLNSTNNYGFSWNHTKKPGSKAAVFLNATKKPIAGSNFDTYTVINACIEGAYAYSGSTTIAIPSGYDLWSTDGNGYCHTGKAYTLDEVKAAETIILYTAYEAEKITVDGTTICSGCGMAYTCENPEHDQEIVSISYDRYDENGIKVLKCNTCGLEKAAEVVALPIFTCLGYSSLENGDASISIAFNTNSKAMEEYTKVTGKTLKYGVFAVSKDKLGENDVFGADGSLVTGAISFDVTDYEYSAFALKIIGFADNQKATMLAMGAYVAVTDGETTTYSYLQDDQKGEKVGNYYFVSYNTIVPPQEA